jgi:hypothetical protein
VLYGQTFPEVPPGQFHLFQKVTQRTIRGTMGVFRPVQIAPVTVQLAETTTVARVLYKLTARLSMPAGVQLETNWNLNAVAAQTQLVEGQRISESLKESGGGMWAAEDLPAGDYILRANVLIRSQPVRFTGPTCRQNCR